MLHVLLAMPPETVVLDRLRYGFAHPARRDWTHSTCGLVRLEQFVDASSSSTRCSMPATITRSTALITGEPSVDDLPWTHAPQLDSTGAAMTDGSPANVHQALRELRPKAQEAHAGRAAHLLSGGPDSHLTQTVIAMRSGTSLSEHENPGEATVFVLEGEVRLTFDDGQTKSGRSGDILVIPDVRHGLDALLDSAILLTAVKRVD
ncbi:MAG TPA: cupin domain-containing protein [Nocardioidaceae bacterium]|nr:cupin domain-containing protein [Nocardioidaceae bacterium]